MRRRIVRPTVVFPQPDSPTRPRVFRSYTVKLTPSTALTWPTVREKTPRRMGKWVLRSRTSTRGALVCEVGLARWAGEAAAAGESDTGESCTGRSPSFHHLRSSAAPPAERGPAGAAWRA